jgi:hypothetical protein
MHINRKELGMKNLCKAILLGLAVFFLLTAPTGFNNEVRCEEHPKADTSVTEKPKADQPKAEQTTTVQPKAEQPQAEHPKSEHPKAEHSTLEHPK